MSNQQVSGIVYDIVGRRLLIVAVLDSVVGDFATSLEYEMMLCFVFAPSSSLLESQDLVWCSR